MVCLGVRYLSDPFFTNFGSSFLHILVFHFVPEYIYFLLLNNFISAICIMSLFFLLFTFHFTSGLLAKYRLTNSVRPENFFINA
jgi:hypothetical protein